MSEHELPGLPSIEDLGHSLAAARVAHNAADANRDEIASSTGMRIAAERAEGLRKLISTMKAETLADVAVQVDVAIELVSVLATSDGADWEDVACAVERMLLSIWPVVATAAGCSLATGHGDALLNLRRHRFAALEGVA